MSTFHIVTDIVADGSGTGPGDWFLTQLNALGLPPNPSPPFGRLTCATLVVLEGEPLTDLIIFEKTPEGLYDLEPAQRGITLDKRDVGLSLFYTRAEVKQRAKIDLPYHSGAIGGIQVATRNTKVGTLRLRCWFEV